jgi:hypothetical protein
MEAVLTNGVHYLVFIKESFDRNFKSKRMKDKNLYCINLGNTKRSQKWRPESRFLFFYKQNQNVVNQFEV